MILGDATFQENNLEDTYVSQNYSFAKSRVVMSTESPAGLLYSHSSKHWLASLRGVLCGLDPF